MSSLSSIAYRMDRLTPQYLRRLHGLELRYTSLACERILIPDPHPQPVIDANSLGDGMLCPYGAVIAFASCAWCYYGTLVHLCKQIQ
jgi:hypothetical protein